MRKVTNTTTSIKMIMDHTHKLLLEREKNAWSVHASFDASVLAENNGLPTFVGNS